MSVKRMALTVGSVLLVLAAAASARSERPYLGVRLDPEPLSALLTKHLGLASDQGIRIKNVNVGSPADKAGLERDDIIVRFRGNDVTDMEEFVEAVRGAGVDTEVSLEVIHLGQRKTLSAVLAPLADEVEWKYPPEPEIVTSWRPGKFFKIGPEGQEWIEMPFDKIPEAKFDVKEFFKEIHVYHHSTDGEEFTITIEGDPAAEDSRVIVRAEDKEHSTTVGELDALPEKYHSPAEEALENARKSSRRQVQIREFHLPEPPAPNVWMKHFEDMRIPRPNLDRWSEKKDRAFEKLQEQMKRLGCWKKGTNRPGNHRTTVYLRPRTDKPCDLSAASSQIFAQGRFMEESGPVCLSRTGDALFGPCTTNLKHH